MQELFAKFYYKIKENVARGSYIPNLPEQLMEDGTRLLIFYFYKSSATISLIIN
jgi:hypothetical protein